MENVKTIHNIIAYMCVNDIEYTNLTGAGIELLEGEFNLTDKQLRGLIIQVYKNSYSIVFENNKFYIHPTI